MGTVDYSALWRLVVPETCLVLAALAVLAVDVVGMRGVSPSYRQAIAAATSILGCLAAAFWLSQVAPRGEVVPGMLVAEPLGQLVKLALVILCALSTLISLEADFTPHVGEYFALLLLGTVGMLLLLSAENLLLIFLALELTGLALYLLAAFNPQNAQAAEAGLKYFFFGSAAAAFTLFGFSLVFGASGSLELRAIARALAGQPLDPLLAVALVMTLVGFGFKVAAVPFHLWAPDVYQGAPIPSAAWIASGSKVAGFFILAKLLLMGFAGLEGSGVWGRFVPGWMPVLAAMATGSMLLGNLAALVQTSVKRLLAYSAIAHAGYALLGILAHSTAGVSSLVYYAVTYALATLGAFGVLSVVADRAGDVSLASLAGLSRRAPLLSGCLLVFLLSLAGVPPLAGFLGKFYLFAAALHTGAAGLGLLWVVALAIALSAVSLYYYLLVLKQVFVVDPPPAVPERLGGVVFQGAIVAAAAGVVVLGCAPEVLLRPLAAALATGGF
jgi:NADH-quinone oxidoreductase subunit N